MIAVDRPQLQAWGLFLRTHASLVARLEQELENERCLPLTWYDVLFQLSLAPGSRLRMQDLVRALVLSKSGLSRRIDRMVDMGLVTREGCRRDARVVYAVLTPAGEEALAAATPVHLRGIGEHFARYLSDEEACVLRSAFERILAGLECNRTGSPDRLDSVPECN